MAGDNLYNDPKKMIKQRPFNNPRHPFQEKAREIFVNNAVSNADDNDYLGTLMQVAKDACNGLTRIGGPTKKKEKIHKKIVEDYNNNFSSVKDVVRMSLIAESETALREAREALKIHCTPANGLQVIKNEWVTYDAVDNPCGYSGFNFVVTLPNGSSGEIQGAIPEIMFGKMSKDKFCEAFTDGPTSGVNVHNALMMKYKIKCGMGHALYDIWKSEKYTVKGLTAADLCYRMYYFLREKTPNQQAGEELNSELVSFSEKFQQHFGE